MAMMRAYLTSHDGCLKNLFISSSQSLLVISVWYVYVTLLIEASHVISSTEHDILKSANGSFHIY